MMARGGLLLALALLFAAPADAQTLVLCDAEWMDAERVLALITVEVDSPGRYVFQVTDCHEESAQVSVRGPDGLDRGRDVRLVGTAPEARPRLVALVLVELVRLGTRGAPPAEGGADAEEAAELEPASAPPDEEEPAEPEPASAPPDAAAPSDEASVFDTEFETDLEAQPAPLALRPAADPYAPQESATEVDSPPSRPWYERRADTKDDEAQLGSCGGEGLSARLSARGCSRAFGVAVGTARHQLRHFADASLWHYQLRLRYRWRFLFFGARAAGRLRQTSWSGATVNVASYTVAFGLELGSKRFESGALLAFAVSAEVGAIRYRERESAGGCSPFGDCGDFAQSRGARSTYGGLLSMRLEIPIRKSALLFEVEGGWTRGLQVTSFGTSITGLGGGQLSFLAGVAFGVGGES